MAKKPTMDRESILDDAANAINGQRDLDYGSPENNFGTIAQFWSTYFTSKFGEETEVSGADVAALLILLKTARQINSPSKVDNWVDIAGYAACGGEVAAIEAVE